MKTPRRRESLERSIASALASDRARHMMQPSPARREEIPQRSHGRPPHRRAESPVSISSSAEVRRRAIAIQIAPRSAVSESPSSPSTAHHAGAFMEEATSAAAAAEAFISWAASSRRAAFSFTHRPQARNSATRHEARRTFRPAVSRRGLKPSATGAAQFHVDTCLQAPCRKH